MRVLIVADVHANLPALDAILAKERFDKVICAGDLVDYGPHPNEVIEALRSLKALCVMGDHEYALLTGRRELFNPYAAWANEWTSRAIKEENREFLRGLRLGERLALDGKVIALFHGSPLDPLWEYVFPGTPREHLREILRAAKADILVLGHTHIPFTFTWRGRILINPGSVGQPRDGDPRAAYAVLDPSDWDVRLRRVDYDVDRTVEDMMREGFPDFLWRRLYEGI